MAATQRGQAAGHGGQAAAERRGVAADQPGNSAGAAASPGRSVDNAPQSPSQLIGAHYMRHPANNVQPEDGPTRRHFLMSKSSAVVVGSPHLQLSRQCANVHCVSKSFTITGIDLNGTPPVEAPTRKCAERIN